MGAWGPDRDLSFVIFPAIAIFVYPPARESATYSNTLLKEQLTENVILSPLISNNMDACAASAFGVVRGKSSGLAPMIPSAIIPLKG